MFFPRQISEEQSNINPGWLAQCSQITQRHNYAQVFRIIWGNSYLRLIFLKTFSSARGLVFKVNH